MAGGTGLARIALIGVCLAVLATAGCGTDSDKIVGEYPTKRRDRDSTPYEWQKREAEGGIFGPGGLFFGGDAKAAAEGEGGGGGIGVNSYLWRASLDTVAFMPVNAADPFGGVILTDWYTMPDAPDERFKMNVYILGRSLRADGIRVAVFKQVKTGDGWADAALPSDTNAKVEDAILMRARQLRFDSLSQR